jgi:hypothetical protein
MPCPAPLPYRTASDFGTGSSRGCKNTGAPRTWQTRSAAHSDAGSDRPRSQSAQKNRSPPLQLTSPPPLAGLEFATSCRRRRCCCCCASEEGEGPAPRLTAACTALASATHVEKAHACGRPGVGSVWECGVWGPRAWGVECGVWGPLARRTWRMPTRAAGRAARLVWGVWGSVECVWGGES